MIVADDGAGSPLISRGGARARDHCARHRRQLEFRVDDTRRGFVIS